MRRSALALLILAPVLARAQSVSVGAGAERRSAAFITEAQSQNHVVVTGTGRVDFPRDSVITSTLIVIGRPTYLASKVEGNVVVIGGDLFLRPGSEIRGHAVAIGGTVATTTLGTVGGRVESYRDDQYDVTPVPGGFRFDYRAPLVDYRIPVVQPAGLYGLLLPTYDRVEGLSLPVGALVSLVSGKVEIEPSVTYRTRHGRLDPGVAVRTNPEAVVRFAGDAGYETRTNDAWIYSDLVNTATTIGGGLDARNYFRSKGGVGRVFVMTSTKGRSIEPFIGGRYEQVSPLAASGGVFSFVGRKSAERMLRPNPLVEAGTIRSALLGARVYDTTGVVVSRIRAEIEQGYTNIAGKPSFTQVTLDARTGFPTFGTQTLRIEGHAVWSGGQPPSARYAYLGGSGTLPVLDMLELGGSHLLFIESRYLIPLLRIQLPFVGSPVVTLKHMMGSAGVGSLPSLEQEVGAGIGLSALRIELNVDASRTDPARRRAKLSIGISLTN